jgi:hypothetical protein
MGIDLPLQYQLEIKFDIEGRPTMAQVPADYGGTTAFVSGGTSGINLGVVPGFAAAGARVAVMSRS